MTDSRSLKITLFAGILCLLIPASIYGMWIYAFNQADQQEQRVNIFKSYFPEFLQGRFDTTYLSIIFLVAAVLLFIRVMGKAKGGLRTTAVIFFILSSLLLFLNVFSLM